MAFFKFRQSKPPQPKSPSRTADPAASTDTIEALRRRARHRLIGAVVLVALAVVGFPLLFDTQTRPVAVNAPITIPDPDRAAPLAVPARTPATSVSASASLGDREEVVPSVSRASAAGAVSHPEPPVGGRTAVAERAAEAPAPAPARAAPASAEQRTAAPHEPPSARAPREEDAKAKREADEAKAKREADARAKRDDAARARAALEGRAASSDKPAPAATSADNGRFIVQVGAFADADKARDARQKAERAGLKTYTQVVDTKDGKRTRVRLGPYASRAEAEKAADALKKAGLSGSIFSL